MCSRSNLLPNLVTAPIVGTTSLKNLEEIIGGVYFVVVDQCLHTDSSFTAAVHIKLTEEEITYLEEAYKPQEIIGHA
jgi:hypothetical protein